MKSLFSFLGISLLSLLITPSCKSKAQQDATNLASALQENAPVGNPTSEAGYYMKANVDGKDWVATHMIPDERANGLFRIQGQQGETSIGFYISTRTLEPGKTRNFDASNAADLMTPEKDGGIYGGYAGMVTVTKNDGQWVEGNFNFTGSTSSSTKTVPVTDGFFRVAVPKGN